LTWSFVGDGDGDRSQVPDYQRATDLVDCHHADQTEPVADNDNINDHVITDWVLPPLAAGLVREVPTPTLAHAELS
jgi:hypothetical protein